MTQIASHTRGTVGQSKFRIILGNSVTHVMRCRKHPTTKKSERFGFFLFFWFFFFYLFAISRAALAEYGGSQARGLIGAVAASLHQSHSNAESEPRLQPTPQLTAMPDP